MSNEEMSFEGENIDNFSVTIRQAKLDYSKPLARGETVKLVVEVECTAVSIRENQRTGEILRDHIVRVKGLA
jgi:hypothetical protein